MSIHFKLLKRVPLITTMDTHCTTCRSTDNAAKMCTRLSSDCELMNTIYRVVQKRVPTLLSVTLLTDFHNSFTVGIVSKFPILAH